MPLSFDGNFISTLGMFYILISLMNIYLLETIEWKLNEWKKKRKIGRYDMHWSFYVLNFVFMPTWIYIWIWYAKVRIKTKKPKKKNANN